MEIKVKYIGSIFDWLWEFVFSDVRKYFDFEKGSLKFYVINNVHDPSYLGFLLCYMVSEYMKKENHGVIIFLHYSYFFCYFNHL